LDPGEQCDKRAARNTGAYGGCKSTCQLAPYCGDGVKQANEGCDDEVAPYCGDRRVNGSEECDGQVGCTASCEWDSIK
jgi:hypothetical protein